MSNQNDQKIIIQEQTKANERIIRAVEHSQEGASNNQAPINERVKQLRPNERTQVESEQSPPPVDTK
jgi:hypothetical protein